MKRDPSPTCLGKYQEEDEEEAVNRAIIESEIFVSQLLQFFSIFFSINLLYHIFLHFFYTHPQPTTFSYTLNLCVILGRSSLFKSSSAVSVFSFRLCPQNKSWMNALTNFSDTKWNRQTHRKTQRLRTRATRSSL